MIGWLSLSHSFVVPAQAADCPAIADQVAAALSALDQTEFTLAEQQIAAAYSALICQSDVLAPETLLELYWVDGLIALAQNDTKGVVYATLRAVAASHDAGRPPDRFGPELQSSFDTWVERLAQERIAVTVGDGGTAWVDGRMVDAAHPLEVYEGEHLMQVTAPTGKITSWVQELSQNYVITTGIPKVASPELVPNPVPQPVVPVPPPPDPVPPTGRKRPPALVITTLATAGVAGATLMMGLRSEGTFRNAQYLNDTYGKCSRSEPCWSDAREDVIRQDARNANRLYAAGYVVTGVAGGMLVVTIVGFPAR